MSNRRRKIVSVRHDYFVDVLNGRLEMILPSDADIINVRMAFDRDAVELLVVSDEYEVVPENEITPYALDVEVRRPQALEARR